MEQWLSRGTDVTPERRVKRLIALGEHWQIYSTSQDSYILAVTEVLYNEWCENYSLPEQIFMDYDSYKLFCSSGDYLISSLDKGPYPVNRGQIDAFSIAFNAVTMKFPDADLHDAIYIEEYSLILPSIHTDDKSDKGLVYGKWLTGGVNVSAESFGKISQIMSWFPKEALGKSFKLAGFDEVQSQDGDVNDGRILGVQVTREKKDEISYSESDLPEDKFTLVGRPELEQFFNDHIVDIVLHQEQYKRMGIPFPGATILYGPPGCGKTYAVEKLSEYLGWKRFDIDSSTIASSFIHDTSKKISEIFNSAIKSAPSIIVIDEMEAFLSNRNHNSPGGTHHIEEVAEFLRRIPEAISSGVLIFAMTNMIDAIDPAILRRGRFDHIIEVRMANKEEIAALLKVKFSELPVAEDVDVQIIAEKLDGHPMSDVTFVLREAGRMAVKSGNEHMNKMCFDKALDILPKKEDKRRIGFNH